MIYKWYLSGQNEDTPHISSLDILDDIVPWLHILWKGAEMQDKFGNDGKIDPLFLYYMDNIVPKRRLGKTIALPPPSQMATTYISYPCTTIWRLTVVWDCQNTF